MLKSSQGPSLVLLKLILICLTTSHLLCAADAPTLNIKVDQVGYPSRAAKIVIVSASAQTFELKRASDQVTVFQGRLGTAATDANSGDTVEGADFTEFQQPGVYYLEVPGVGRSWPFTIGPDVFPRTYYLAMRAFYGQRCGTPVDLGPEFPGYKHPACHLKGAFDASSGKSGPRDNVGGWHDAGDYGRYVVNSGFSTGTLLWAWELFSSKLAPIKLNIPETGNGTPDILNEARWNLEWMLKMQDADGGVWHKQTSARFPGFIMPQDDDLTSLVIGTGSEPYKSTCATADLAAVAAIASRVYAPFDKEFAQRNQRAAIAAWHWTELHPNVTFRNPPGITTGEYGDRECSDERLWAASELWRATGDPVFNRYFLDNYAAFLPALRHPNPASWSELAPLGLWAYAVSNRPGADAQAVAEIRKQALAAAHEIVERTRGNPYHISMQAGDFSWGSNGQVANYGMQLLVSNVLSPDPAFIETALEDLHYLLGRNAFSLSFVTQVGANPFRHPHHRPSGADNNPEPWPGMLSGGPNGARQDAVLRALPANLPPARVYADEQASYASNEICINWQAAFVFLLAGVMD